MSLEDTYVKKFKEAYEKEFKEKITEKEAGEKFFRLVRLVRTILYGAPSNSRGDHPSGRSSVDESEFNANLKD